MRKRLSAILVLCLSAVMAYGVIGTGAQFLKTVTASQTLQVGTFDCLIVAPVTPGAVIAADSRSVTYTAPDINSSAAGSAPFSFTVANTGSIDQSLTLATSAIGAPFSVINAPFAARPLAHGANTTIDTGVQWGELSNANLGGHASETWTVSCGENAPAAIFSNTPALLPSNLPSYGVEAYYYNELGGGVTFAGSARKLSTATVTMSSWACETGSWAAGTCATTPGHTYAAPITFTLYNVGTSGAVGTQIAKLTQTFQIPYRPSADSGHCTDANAGKWFDGTECKNGLATNITFTFAGETLPNNAIFGIAYNTSTNGYSPLGAGLGGPLDSLNIASYPGTGVAAAAIVGSWMPDNSTAYVGGPSAPFAAATTWAGGGLGAFAGYMPAVQITATN